MIGWEWRKNDWLLLLFTHDEFKAALWQMHQDKSPGLDGLNPCFYLKFWSAVGDEVVRECSS